MADRSRPREPELRFVPLDDLAAAPVLAGLAEEYSNRYGGSEELASTKAAEFAAPAGAFLVLLDDGETVAGGGYRRLADDVCEIKRVWTSPDRRRQGLAGTVLSALEAKARVSGYTTIRLETGPAQPEAVAFYEGRGYRRIPVFGPYERALAFERCLDRPPT